MSGGRFGYAQHHINDIADAIESIIGDNNYELPDDIIQEFKNGVLALRQAYVYAQRIDWLLSSDDGEDSFRKRLKEDLAKLKG